jgi:hypothetical protein
MIGQNELNKERQGQEMVRGGWLTFCAHENASTEPLTFDTIRSEGSQTTIERERESGLCFIPCPNPWR